MNQTKASAPFSLFNFPFMGKACTYILFIFLPLLGCSQSPYQLNWKTDGLLTGTAAVLVTGSAIANIGLEALSEEEIEALDPQDINRFDRWATEQESKAAGHRSDIGLYVPLALANASPLVFPLIEKDRASFGHQFFTLSVMWLQTNLITFGGTEWVKSTALRTRPEVYQEGYVQEEVFSENYIDSRKAFFSGHTSISAANCFFLSKVFADYYPESTWKPLVWAIGATVPAWTGVERILAGKHFPTDVLTAYVFGAACGYFVPHWHKKKVASGTVQLTALPFARNGAQGIRIKLLF